MLGPRGARTYESVNPTLDLDVEDEGDRRPSVYGIFERVNRANKGQLGTVMGVFVPCVVGVFGVIIFERLGFVIGQAGLIQSLLVLLLGYAVVVLSVMSISAIATNGKVEGGG